MLKVLIVEDDPMVREINEKFINRISCYKLVGSLNTLTGAKEAIVREQPHLVLLDVFFPQGRGIDLLKWIRKQDIKLDVILITADKSKDTVEEAFRYGVVDYLVKPFTFDRFKDALVQYKNRKAKLSSIDCVEQEMIDSYTLPEGKSHVREHEEIGEMKGFSELTYEKVLKGIEAMGDKTFTAQQIAQKIGVSRITARRYLEHLEKEQKLTIELEYGKVGRPKNKYKRKK